VPVAPEDVVTRRSVEAVVARPAEEPVVAVAAEELVVAGLRAGIADEVVAGAAVESVVAAAEELVVAGAAAEDVRALRLVGGIAGEGVVAAAPVELVVALAAGQAILVVGPRLARAHVELHGNTFRADFDLDSSFPFLRSAQLSGLSWGLSFFGTDLRSLRRAPGPLGSHDQLPDNPDTTGNSTSPEVRQSDGKTVVPD
jgi:hypothetical protein